VSELLLQLVDASRAPLDDMADVIVSSPQSNVTVSVTKNIKASATLRLVGLKATEPYLVRVYPVRHRPVGQFHRAPASGSTLITLACPIDPERVVSVTFPKYSALSTQAKAILRRSRLDHSPLGVSGASLYYSVELGNVPKAGLLNLVAKMERTMLPDGSSAIDHVDSLYRVRGDRVFANVAKGLRDLVKIGVSEGTFRPVSGSLHRPDPEFQLVDSYKTAHEPFGNLQITFFATIESPLRFTADIDIDDAAGLEHSFQVLSHWLTGGSTHPFDIHDILLYHQHLDPGYQLLT
jgi:hypothetical protein